MRTKYKSKRKKSRKNKRGLSVYDGPSCKKYIFILLILILSFAYLYYVSPDTIQLKINIDDIKKDEIKEIVREVLTEQKELENQNKIIEEVKQTEESSEPAVEEPVIEEKQVTSRGGSARAVSNSTTLSGYRITSYHPGDNCASGTKTGSGKSINDFSTMKIGTKNVYTYKGKIVVACATKELLNTGYSVRGAQNAQNKYYFKYYQEFTLVIDGVNYQAICLDSCGAAMWEGEYRIDIFVPSSSDIIDRSNTTAII